MFGAQKKVSALRLLYHIYHRAKYSLHEYLYHFVAASSTGASTAVGELALVNPRCITDQCSRSLLPAAVCLWNLLLSGVFSGGTLSSFKSATNVCHQRLCLIFFSFCFRLFLLFYSLPSIIFLGSFWFVGCSFT